MQFTTILPFKEEIMFKNIPEFELMFNKAIYTTEATIDFNAAILTKSLEYFNELTENKFTPATVQVVETINKVTHHAKENLKTTTGAIKPLFATSK